MERSTQEIADLEGVPQNTMATYLRQCGGDETKTMAKVEARAKRLAGEIPKYGNTSSNKMPSTFGLGPRNQIDLNTPGSDLEARLWGK